MVSQLDLRLEKGLPSSLSSEDIPVKRNFSSFPSPLLPPHDGKSEMSWVWNDAKAVMVAALSTLLRAEEVVDAEGWE